MGRQNAPCPWKRKLVVNNWRTEVNLYSILFCQIFMFDYFAKEKSDFLKKKDKSRKGCVDDDIKELIKIINSKKDYYTTSSCAGRIVLLEMKSKKKNECNWIFAKHDKITLNDILNSLKKFRSEE